MVKRQNEYYDIRTPLSHNPFFVIATGGRGIGKTYSSLDYIKKKVIDKGKQFFYVRRYGSDMKMIKKSGLFNDFKFKNEIIIEDGDEYYGEFLLFKVDKNGKKISKTRRVVGYYTALSTSDKLKSIAYPDVDILLYEEFLIEKRSRNTYLEDEVFTFFNLLETIFRTRLDIKVLMLSNSTTIVNPYFSFFGITDYEKEFQVTKLRLPNPTGGNPIEYKIVVNFPPNRARENDISPLTALFQMNEEYYNYSANNEFSDAVDTRILPIPPKAKQMSRIRFNNEIYYLWNSSDSKLHISMDKGSDTYETLVISSISTYEANVRLGKDQFFISMIANALNSDLLFFDKPSTRESFMKIVNNKRLSL